MLLTCRGTKGAASHGASSSAAFWLVGEGLQVLYLLFFFTSIISLHHATETNISFKISPRKVLPMNKTSNQICSFLRRYLPPRAFLLFQSSIIDCSSCRVFDSSIWISPDDRDDRKTKCVIKVCGQFFETMQLSFVFCFSWEKHKSFCWCWSGPLCHNKRHHITPGVGLQTLLPFDALCSQLQIQVFLISTIPFVLLWHKKYWDCAIFFPFTSIQRNASPTFCFVGVHWLSRQSDVQVNSCSWLRDNYSTLQGRCDGDDDDGTGSVSGRRPPAELRLVRLTSQRPLLTRRLSGGADAH